MGLLPDTQNCGCACAGNAGNVFPVTAGKQSRHASRHVRHAGAVMHTGIANLRYPLKSAAGENVPGIPGACATCNFTYLVRGPCNVTTSNLILLIQCKISVPVAKPCWSRTLVVHSLPATWNNHDSQIPTSIAASRSRDHGQNRLLTVSSRTVLQTYHVPHAYHWVITEIWLASACHPC